MGFSARKKANIAANALGGKFDNDKLAVMLAELKMGVFEVESIGIDTLLRKQIDIMNKRVKDDFKPIDFGTSDYDNAHVCPKCKFKF
jgi:hypothetical protein